MSVRMFKQCVTTDAGVNPFEGNRRTFPGQLSPGQLFPAALKVIHKLFTKLFTGILQRKTPSYSQVIHKVIHKQLFKQCVTVEACGTLWNILVEHHVEHSCGTLWNIVNERARRNAFPGALNHHFS